MSDKRMQVKVFNVATAPTVTPLNLKNVRRELLNEDQIRRCLSAMTYEDDIGAETYIPLRQTERAVLQKNIDPIKIPDEFGIERWVESKEGGLFLIMRSEKEGSIKRNRWYVLQHAIEFALHNQDRIDTDYILGAAAAYEKEERK